MAELDRPEGAWVGLDLHLGWLTTTTFSTRSSTLRPLTGPALGVCLCGFEWHEGGDFGIFLQPGYTMLGMAPWILVVVAVSGVQF